MDTNPTSEILLQHGRFVQALAHALVRDPHAADDVAQETWIQWLRRGAGGVGAPRAWLRSAVRHLAANRRRADDRRARHEALGAPGEPGQSPADGAERAELLHRVIDAVFALEEPYRATILARYFRGLASRELAAERGEPLATVRSREQRALELLRAKLDRECDGRGAWAALLVRFAPGEPAGAATAASLVPWVAVGVGLAAVVLVWRTAAGDERVAPEVSGPALARESGAFSNGAGREVGHGPSSGSARTEVALEVATETSNRSDADSAGALVGRSIDTEGNALAGVTVHFSRSGKELASTRSDEQGRFRVDGLPSVSSVTAELSGYRFLHATDPERDPGEPSVPMRVTLAPVGKLVVRVHDGAGRGLAGCSVSARPRPEELLDDSGTEETLTAHLEPIKAETDADGLAELPDVWSGVHLLLRLDPEEGVGADEVTFDRELDGHLLLDPPAGSPIVLRSGRALELDTALKSGRVVRGVVLEADGRPARKCSIVARDEGYAARGEGGRPIGAPTDEQGSFELSLRPGPLRGPLHVYAFGSGDEITLAETPSSTWKTTVPRSRAERVVSLDELESGPLLRLVLAPAEILALIGKVQLADGRGFDWSAHVLTLLEHDGAAPADGTSTSLAPDGAFAFRGLRPGLYDVVVSQRTRVQRSRLQGEPMFTCFPALPAGVELAPLELRDSAEVHLRIRGSALGFVHFARLFPARPREFQRRVVESPLVIRSSAPWLAPNSLEDGVFDRAEGTWIAALDHVSGADELELALGDAGWYQLRVECEGKAPLATELLWLEAGEHELVFEPPEVGELHGRLVADGTRELYGLQLAGEDGRALAPVQHLRASGEFRLRALGAGRYLLRFGSLDELAEGRFRRELALDVVPGENPPLHL